MKTITQPLREEHKELFPHVESLREAGDVLASGQVTPAVRKLVDEAYAFLTHHLIPHAMAEDKALYPVVQKVMGAPRATATMSRDHVEVGALTHELEELRAGLTDGVLPEVKANALRRVLYGLYSLVKLHFAKEEEIYLPLLDEQLSSDEAVRMFSAMEAAAGEAKAHIH